MGRGLADQLDHGAAAVTGIRGRALRLLVAAAVAVPAAGVVPAAAAPAGELERVIVTLRPSAGTTRDVANRLMADNGGTVGPVYRGVLKGFAAKVPAGRLNALRANPNVDVVIPDAPISAGDVPVADPETPANPADTPTTPSNAEVPPGIRRIGAATVQGTKVGTGTATDVDIAILDTGVNAHADLTIAGGVNCTSDTGCVAGSYADAHSHGTHVAGTAAAKDNGIGVVGTAPGARVWAVKVLGDNGGGYLSWFMAGLDWVAARGDIEVVNASLGGGRYAPVDTAIANATAAGVVVVVAAGNEAQDAANVSPASSPNAITVSAYADYDGAPGALGGGGDDTFASFSNYGESVDVAAPGVGILSTSHTGGYVSMSGTSMASPHVAGAAATYIATHAVEKSATRWETVLSAFRGAWGAGQQSSCGFSGGRSSEPVVIMGGCAGGDTVPPTPVSLTATAGDKQVGLSWSASSDSSGIAGYRIYRATGATGAFALLTTAAGATTAYTDIAVVNKTVYRYYVVAVDGAPAANPSAASAIRSATPGDTTAPGAPTLSGVASDLKATLTWTGVTDSSGIKGYQVWRQLGSAAPVLRTTAGATVRKYVDAAVANNTTYRYTVRAIDVPGNLSAHSNAVDVRPYDNAAPTTPAPSVVVGDHQLTVKWAASKDSSGVASYAVYRAEGSAAFGAPVVVSGTTLSQTFTQLANGVTHRFAVSATDILGQTSPLSAVKYGAARDLTGPVPVMVSGSASDGAAALSWSTTTDESGVASYRIYRATGTATTFTQVGTVTVPGQSWQQSGLTAGTAYRYYVRAVDTKNNLGLPSNTVTVTTPTTGVGVAAISYALGTPGASTTPITATYTVRSTTAANVPVAGAKVYMNIVNQWGGLVASGYATASATGVVTTKITLPRGMTYRMVITGITAIGRTWDGQTPTNSVVVS